MHALPCLESSHERRERRDRPPGHHGGAIASTILVSPAGLTSPSALFHSLLFLFSKSWERRDNVVGRPGLSEATQESSLERHRSRWFLVTTSCFYVVRTNDAIRRVWSVNAMFVRWETGLRLFDCLSWGWRGIRRPRRCLLLGSNQEHPQCCKPLTVGAGQLRSKMSTPAKLMGAISSL